MVGFTSCAYWSDVAASHPLKSCGCSSTACLGLHPHLAGSTRATRPPDVPPDPHIVYRLTSHMLYCLTLHLRTACTACTANRMYCLPVPQLNVAGAIAEQIDRVTDALKATCVLYALSSVCGHALAVWAGLVEARQDAEGAGPRGLCGGVCDVVMWFLVLLVLLLVVLLLLGGWGPRGWKRHGGLAGVGGRVECLLLWCCFGDPVAVVVGGVAARPWPLDELGRRPSLSRSRLPQPGVGRASVAVRALGLYSLLCTLSGIGVPQPPALSFLPLSAVSHEGTDPIVGVSAPHLLRNATCHWHTHTRRRPLARNTRHRPQVHQHWHPGGRGPPT